MSADCIILYFFSRYNPTECI